MDFIGAARPSIADPFLPRKIEEGRLDDIRECIGCNVCVTGDFTMTPIRCTQNPSMGEEWRRGWHPERIRSREADASILIIGAGPAGLEAGRALGQRGYKVTISDAAREAGRKKAVGAGAPQPAPSHGGVRGDRRPEIGDERFPARGQFRHRDAAAISAWPLCLNRHSRPPGRQASLKR